ncbi:pyroglutamyl-peptidase 1-like [Xenia sp. Carnegie-2017]|uniref:pyroglutamyl-peptidase 1-like n=1 Tax=Xenia sp. Carnegie-2017 TaxID=2897299 RepID=UPI001F039D04|nr:pyroglutamyl-peptidase 1-like [Xenia sp. Carnegie-2017]
MENVLVTGFGPFAEHEVNASWEVVKELANMGLDGKGNLVIKEIPVSYDYVLAHVPELWRKYKPKLCIHVGVSSITEVVQLEKHAYNSNYSLPDINDEWPPNNECVKGGHECHQTNIDVAKVCQQLKKNDNPCKVDTSSDAGRYLCEFIYYMSMNERLKPEFSSSSVLFVHVPMLDKPYSKENLAKTLKLIALEILS